jgi:hypothetical protein
MKSETKLKEIIDTLALIPVVEVEKGIYSLELFMSHNGF